MTTGEWSCLLSFTWAPLTCSERVGSEKCKMKIYVSSRIRNHTTSVHDRKVSALDRSATLVRYQVEHLQSKSILIYEYKWICDNTYMESVMVWYPMQSTLNNYYSSWHLHWDKKWRLSLTFSSNTHVTIIYLTRVVTIHSLKCVSHYLVRHFTTEHHQSLVAERSNALTFLSWIGVM